LEIPKFIEKVWKIRKPKYKGNIAVDMWADRLARRLDAEMMTGHAADLLNDPENYGVLIKRDADGYVQVLPIKMSEAYKGFTK
jgi:hypothetical protein